MYNVFRRGSFSKAHYTAEVPKKYFYSDLFMNSEDTAPGWMGEISPQSLKSLRYPLILHKKTSTGKLPFVSK